MSANVGATRDIAYLVAVAVVLLAGIVLALAGKDDLADLAWLVATLSGEVLMAVAVTWGIIHRRAGVDVIALLAIAGSLALGEYLAGAVITLKSRRV